ncbi:ParA family protein [Alteromonas macleodii]|uniref:ParA family protein n=1 Tax=Alteromonas macleodii TaxID=28108 RepID=UPI00313FE4C6
MNKRTSIINALDYFDEIGKKLRGIVRASQIKNEEPDSNRVVSRLFSLEFQAHLLNLSTKRVRELVQTGELISSAYIEKQKIKFSQEELFHNMEMRNCLPPPTNGRPKVIAVSQYKGGVGKTTSAVNLAVYLALSGYRVTFIDIDPQGTGTEQLWRGSPISFPEKDVRGLDSLRLEDTIYSLLSARDDTYKRPLEDIQIPTAWNNLKLIPSCVMLDTINIEMSLDTTEKNKEFYWDRFRNRINDFENTDIVVIDSSPNINALNLSALFAADVLLMPVLASMSDVSSFYQYVSHMHVAVDDLVRRKLLVKSRLPYFVPRILISNYERGALDKQIKPVDEIIHLLNKITAKDKGIAAKDTFVRTILQKYLSHYLLDSIILRSDAIKEAANKFMPIFEVDVTAKDDNGLKKHNVTKTTHARCEQAFIEFGAEIKQLLNDLGEYNEQQF